MESRRESQQLPRAFAGRILRDLRIEDADEIDIEAIAAHYDCFVRSGGVQGADGRVLSDGRKAVIRVNAQIREPARRRFVIAHELGHVRLKHKPILDVCSGQDLVRYEAGSAEAEANAFAGELLMPGNLVRPMMKRRHVSLELAEELSRSFTTTFTAAAIRMIDVADEPCAVIWSEAKKVKWSISSPECTWFVRKGTPLSPYTHAHDAFVAGKRLPNGPTSVDAERWAEGYGLPDELLEETRWFARFGAAFTLLRER